MMRLLIFLGAFFSLSSTYAAFCPSAANVAKIYNVEATDDNWIKFKPTPRSEPVTTQFTNAKLESDHSIVCWYNLNVGENKWYTIKLKSKQNNYKVIMNDNNKWTKESPQTCKSNEPKQCEYFERKPNSQTID